MRGAIFQACRNGDLAGVQTLVSQQPFCLYETDSNGRIPLHEACRTGHLPVVEFLVGQRSMMNKTDFDQNTPLHEACRSGNAKVVAFLLSYMNSSKSPKNCFGRLPIHEAARKGHAEIVTLLRECFPMHLRRFDNEDCLALHHACRSGSVDTVKCLLSGFRHGSFQIRDSNGLLPLHHACYSASLETVAFIYEQKPDAVLVPDKLNRLPLDIAKEVGMNEIVDFLSAETKRDFQFPVATVVPAVARPADIGLIVSEPNESDQHEWSNSLGSLGQQTEQADIGLVVSRPIESYMHDWSNSFRVLGQNCVSQIQEQGRSCVRCTRRRGLVLPLHRGKTSKRHFSRQHAFALGLFLALVFWYFRIAVR